MKRNTVPNTNVSKSLVEVLYESNRTFYQALYWFKVVRFNNRKFKLSIVLRNGSNMTDCKIQVMNQSGSFDFVASAYETNAPFENDYYNIEEGRVSTKIMNMCTDCFEAMEKYITKVYA